MRRWRSALAAALVANLGLAAAAAAEPSTAKAVERIARQYDYAVTTTDCHTTTGTATASTVNIEGRRGWHVNGKAPVILRFDPAPPERVAFAVTMTPSQPGRTTVLGEARFVVCQPGKCKPVVEPIRIDVLATRPSP